MAESSSTGPSSLENYDYELPDSAVAQRPLPRRDASRLLVLGEGGTLVDQGVGAFPSLLREGDCLVVNDTRVRAARLRGRAGGREAEVLLVRDLQDGRHLALVRPGRSLRIGREASGSGWRARVVGLWEEHPGGRVVEVETDPGLELEELAEMPIPPYVREPLADRDRYQTVYSTGAPRSAAAPTAGLHLTERLLAQLEGGGVRVLRIQLEIGLATFVPIRVPDIEDHVMHRELFEVPEETALAISGTRAAGGRVVAVGTTVVRCLESAVGSNGDVLAGQGETDLYIRPGFQFQAVDGLLTNFHQPRSSLLVMVSAFFGHQTVVDAYQHALERGYRFLSFGDCMFGWQST